MCRYKPIWGRVFLFEAVLSIFDCIDDNTPLTFQCYLIYYYLFIINNYFLIDNYL